MFWKMTCEKACEAVDFPAGPAARFVLHRHRDAAGEHLDLRLEVSGHLEGWRVDGLELSGECWASAKAPHPLKWLDEDGDAERLDAGVYAWEVRDGDSGTLALSGKEGVRRVRISRAAGLAPSVAGAILDGLKQAGAEACDGAALIADGVSARKRAIERLCGLGAELDGLTFDDRVWRKTLGGLTLDEIHGQLRSFEVRFDMKYPPQPVSRPEALPEDADAGAETREETALAILRD